jgi:CDP-6-deoxy-D-xylo-4-hexulose-3-dehydrase
MRSHGWSRDRTDASSWNQLASGNNEKFLFVSTGYNFRPMEIQAAIGSSQIKEIDNFVEKRRLIAKKVSKAIEGSPLRVIGSETLGSEKEKSNSWMLIPIYVSDDKSTNMKDRIVKFLEEQGIETRPVLTGNFLAQPSIQRISKHSVDSKSFTSAQDITNNGFLIGAHHDLSENQIEYLCKNLHEISHKF